MTTEPAGPAVFTAFLGVQGALDAITKANRVQEGPARFAFRGVDDVMNALHAPMVEHGLICVPQVQERIPEVRLTRSGGTMNVVHLRVRFAFYAADGSTFAAEAWGEGQDSGDKATGKAHSMAYKSALLQAFHVPTEAMPDADNDTTPAEHSGPPSAPDLPHVTRARAAIKSMPNREAWEALRVWATGRGIVVGSTLTEDQSVDLCDYAATLLQPDPPADAPADGAPERTAEERQAAPRPVHNVQLVHVALQRLTDDERAAVRASLEQEWSKPMPASAEMTDAEAMQVVELAATILGQREPSA